MTQWTIRDYQPSDFETALSAHQEAASADRVRHHQLETFRRLMNSPSEDPSARVRVVPDAEGRIAGLLWLDVTANRSIRLEGWVHPGCRRRGVGSLLLSDAEGFARAHYPGGTLVLRTYEDLPATVDLFRRQGFVMNRRFYRMKVTLDQPFEALVPPNVVFSSFERDDLESLVETDNAIFEEHWGSHPRSAAIWYRDMVELRPHDPALWTIARHEQNIVGECLCHASMEEPGEGHVSTVGVRRDWRGKGLGRAVLAHGLNRLREAGYKTAALMVDSENTAAVNLYRSMGMDVIRVRLNFLKRLG